MKYIDSSAFVKYYSDEKTEKGARKVISLVDKAKEGKEKLVSSVLLVGECVSALDKWVRLKIITREEFDKILGKFILDVKQLTENNRLILEDINTLSIFFSIDYIVKHHITINDALHLYTALIHKNNIKKFVCSDKNLITAAKKEGLKVWNPEES